MNFLMSFLTSDSAKQYFSDIVRHGLIGLSGILVARGYLHQSDVSNFVAAGGMVAMAWVWQIWENENQKSDKATLVQNLTTTQTTLQTQATQIAQVAQAASSSPVNEVAQVGIALLGSLIGGGAQAATPTPPPPPKK